MIFKINESEIGHLVRVEMSTDGSCLGNPGPGAWAVMLTYTDGGAGVRHLREVAGFCDERTTNNRMELTAVLQGVSLLKYPSRVTVRSDSKYVVGGLNRRMLQWRVSGFPCPLLNADLWQDLERATRRHVLTGVWVKGHADDVDNIRCDQLATRAARQRVNHHDRRMKQPAVHRSYVAGVAA